MVKLKLRLKRHFWNLLVLALNILLIRFLATNSTAAKDTTQQEPPTACGVWQAKAWVPCLPRRTISEFVSTERSRLGLRQLRLLFVGDSQTRYLFCQFSEVLVAAGLAPVGMRPLDPTTRFAFSWVTELWPPVHHHENTSATPVVIGFVTSEYFQGGTAETQSAVEFGVATHIIIGRGCWDMIRRIPQSHITMGDEMLAGFVRWRSEFPRSRIVAFVFPHASIPQEEGVASDRKTAAGASLTGCVLAHHQHMFRGAIHIAAQHANSHMKQSLERIRVLDVDSMTNPTAAKASPDDSPYRPVDGLHHVGQTAAAIIGELLTLLTDQLPAETQQNRHASNDNQQLLPPFIDVSTCRAEALPYYNYVIANVIQQELKAVYDIPSNEGQIGFDPDVHRPQLTQGKENIEILISFAACSHFLAATGRYFGAGNWTKTLQLASTPLESWLHTGHTEIVEKSIRMQRDCLHMQQTHHKTMLQKWSSSGRLRPLLDEVMHKHPLLHCRSILMALRDVGVTSFGEKPHCLNLPFGRRP